MDIPDFAFGENRREDEFEEDLLSALEEWISDRDYFDVSVERSRPILKDISFIFDQSDVAEMVLGFSQTDIVFYTDLGQDFTRNLDELRGIRLEGLGEEEDGEKRSISYPIAILELKSNFVTDDGTCYGTITHDLNTYSRKVAEWKSLFPHLKCYLVFSQRKVGLQSRLRNPNEKILRHVRNFDGVFEFSRVYKESAGEPYVIDREKGEREFESLLEDLESHFLALEGNKYTPF